MNYELGIKNKKRPLSLLFILMTFVAATIAAASVFAANQIKTTETYITDSDAQINSATSSPFSIYIGDNTSGIPNPVKSAHVAVSGVYTGNGSIDVWLDSYAAQTFTMANVGTTPTPFEILYDAAGKINPASAGTYGYTLNITPSGVIIYGLSAKAVESHEYVPPACADGNPSNEKLKTTETYITDSDAQINSATSSPFSIYIGDNTSGIPNPVKSAHVAVSGVYTGNGSIDVWLDSYAAQTFTMANVGTTPTPFEILYDAAGKINPASAGTYGYTLNITPSGVIIYGLSAKAAITHRYKPPSCGGGYAPTGSLESSTFDTGIADGAAFNSIRWEGSIPGGVGRVRLQIATSNSSAGPWNTADYKGPGPACDNTTYYEPAAGSPAQIDLVCSAVQNKRYFRYKAIICSANDCSSPGATTPQIDDIIINWSP